MCAKSVHTLGPSKQRAWPLNSALCEIEIMDRARVQVDFNELVQEDLVLLSKTDEVTDSDGNKLVLSEGINVFIYEFNEYEDGEKECLVADGVAEYNKPEINGKWSAAAKWCCRINKNGITSTNT